MACVEILCKTPLPSGQSHPIPPLVRTVFHVLSRLLETELIFLARILLEASYRFPEILLIECHSLLSAATG
jgi:hypothetical protein